MNTKEIAKQCLLSMKQAYDEKNYEEFGFRTMTYDEDYTVGDTVRNSYDWNIELDCSSYGTEDPVELDGACTTGLTAWCVNYDDEEECNEIIAELEKLININKVYSNLDMIFVGGLHADDGNDENEKIIRDAEVLAIFEK